MGDWTQERTNKVREFLKKEMTNCKDRNCSANLCISLIDALDEIEDLQKILSEKVQMLDSINAAANEIHPANFVKSLNVKDGIIHDAIVAEPFARIFIESLVSLFINGGATNFLSLEFQKGGTEEIPLEIYSVLIQKKTGITPVEKAMELDKKNKILVSQISALIRVGNSMYQDDGSNHEEWQCLVKDIQNNEVK